MSRQETKNYHFLLQVLNAVHFVPGRMTRKHELGAAPVSAQCVRLTVLVNVLHVLFDNTLSLYSVAKTYESFSALNFIHLLMTVQVNSVSYLLSVVNAGIIKVKGIGK